MKSFSVQTRSRTQFIDITELVRSEAENTSTDAVVTVFVPHTTAAVTINESADPDVVRDISSALERMAPWNGGYAHAEGNSAAHIKASLMGSSVTVLTCKGDLQLGTWQAIYFCEFDGPRARTVWVRVSPA